MAEVTKAQRTNIADAVVGELQRAKLGDQIAPGDVALLKQCTEGAVKLAIATRLTADSDEKAKAALTRRSNDINAQLENFKAFASTKARLLFWKKVDDVLTRMLTLTLAAV